MSWGTKYILQWYDAPPFYTEWRVRFKVWDFVGVVQYMKGTESPARLNYESNDEDTHSAIKASFLEMDIMEFTEDQYLELFEYDKKCLVELSRKPVGENETIYWMGWTLAGEYNTLYNQPPKPITVTAVCGLSLLKNVPLIEKPTVQTTRRGVVTDFEPNSPGIYSLREYFYKAFHEIGLDLEIYESFDVYAYGAPKTLGPLSEHFIDTWKWYESGEYKSLYDVLSDLLFNACVGGRVYQKNGKWYMDRVKQLIAGEITYRTYDSTFSLTGTATETLNKGITTQWDVPMNVPVDMSLKKGLLRPYSKITINTDYGLNNNLVRYPNSPNSVTGPIQYSLTTDDDNNVMLLSYRDLNAAYRPILEGIKYNLGYSNSWAAINDQPNNISIAKAFMTLTISGRYRGRMCVRVYIDDEVTGGRYFYESKTWPNYDPQWTRLLNESNPQTDPSGWGCVVYLENDTTEEQDFSETVELNTFGKELSGQMYLVICPPWWASPPASGSQINHSPVLKINVNEISVTWNECKTSDNQYPLVATRTQTNIQEHESTIYTAPCVRQDYYVIPGVSKDHYFRYYLNPHLTYPGLLMYWNGLYGGDLKYLPCQWVVYDETSGADPVKLEVALAQDIMALHAAIGWKVTGTILGQFDIGTVFTYKDRIYMIASMTFDIHLAQTEVILLQIGEAVEILGLESSGDILVTEDSGYIPLNK